MLSLDFRGEKKIREPRGILHIFSHQSKFTLSREDTKPTCKVINNRSEYFLEN